MSYIIPFTKEWPLREDAVRIIGGKAWSVSELVRGGYKVPAGFIVSTDAFRDVLEQTGIAREIHDALSRVQKDNIVTVERASEFIRSLILGVHFPETIRNEIDEHVRLLKAERVCVRSSAIHEDEQGASWAGQYETLVAVTPDLVCASVLKCWASLYSPRAIVYGKSVPAGDQGMAVIVQTFVPAESSGVAFSIHPVTGNSDETFIEAVWGLGEAVVSGEVTPDAYSVSKQHGLREKQIHPQHAEVVAAAHGTTWRTLRAKHGTEQKLADKHILNLAEEVQSVAAMFAYAVDVEWAFADGVVWLLQARPITLGRTHSVKPIVEYVTSREWSLRARHDELLMLYSLRMHGMRVREVNEAKFPLLETALVPRGTAYPLAVVSVESWSSLLGTARTHVVKEPKILARCVARDNDLWRQIGVISSNIHERIERGAIDDAIALCKKSFELYEEHGALYYPIIAMGMQLTKEHGKVAGSEGPQRDHDEWRNSMVFAEEKYVNSVEACISQVIETRNVPISSHEIIKHVTGREVVKWLDGKMLDRELERIIFERSHHGYVHVVLADFPDVDVVLDRGDARAIADHFIRLHIVDEEHAGGMLRGSPVWNGGKPVDGEAVVVLDAKEFKMGHIDLHGKVLIAPQTKPHYIPYLKGVVAMVTDEGGVTSHAAIIAREYHIPTVVGTERATKTIKTGDKVRVDTNTGVVYLLY